MTELGALARASDLLRRRPDVTSWRDLLSAARDEYVEEQEPR